ncbi:hypothetical protein PLICRDRAFT_320615 [Plicaturopsis crispa FD-325 SS-3]|nr:hypothetical protein PLICRDRAFT_320615 [Plicaturopsis crispa FD-325 SS-3]
MLLSSCRVVSLMDRCLFLTGEFAVLHPIHSDDLFAAPVVVYSPVHVDERQSTQPNRCTSDIFFFFASHLLLVHRADIVFLRLCQTLSLCSDRPIMSRPTSFKVSSLFLAFPSCAMEGGRYMM